MSDYKYKTVNGKEVLLTPAEITDLEARDAVWAIKMKDLDKVAYRRQREEKMPSVSEQLEAITEQLQAILSERKIVAEPKLLEVLRKVSQVKQDIPKPKGSKE